MPDELLQAVGPICSTLSLATLQSYMPPASHWKGVGRSSGLDPDRPSSYVFVFIGMSTFTYATMLVKNGTLRLL